MDLDEFDNILVRLKEYGCDPVSTVMKLEDLRNKVKDGLNTEKITNSGAIVSVLETHPNIEYKIIDKQHEIYRWVHSRQVGVSISKHPVFPGDFYDQLFG